MNAKQAKSVFMKIQIIQAFRLPAFSMQKESLIQQIFDRFLSKSLNMSGNFCYVFAIFGNSDFSASQTESTKCYR